MNISSMPNSAASRDVAYHIHPATNFRQHEKVGPLIVERGEGIRIFDADGKSYIEGMAGLWCASLGFSEQRLADAAARQYAKLPYQQTFAHRSNEAVIDLAEALIQKSPVPMSKVMFQSSGSEANDAAIKLVWYYHTAADNPSKRKIIARKGAYHGTTIASASLTGIDGFHKGFGIPLDGFVHVTTPHYYRNAKEGETQEEFTTRLAAELEQTILDEGADTIGAFFAEPVMGAGGVIVPPKDYFAKIQAVLKKYDVLFVADEVICGFCRTGNYWGSQTFGLEPDMIVCAKALSASYFPISAVIMNDRVYQGIADQTAALGAFGHGYTYGGHPVGAAVALETLRIYDEDGILDHVREVSPVLQAAFASFGEHPLVGNTRGVGLLGALEFVADKASKKSFDPAVKISFRVMDSLRERGVLLRALGDSLVCSPPLIINKGEIQIIISALEAALDDTYKWAKGEGLTA